ncbi:MAG: hypothetical protein HPY71_03820 [Firmicutes bacterium]|nr:hypothetical protein [Bacillota bacterium]
MMIERSGINRTILDGRVAVVPVSGQGIGKETARILAYLGAAVVITETIRKGILLPGKRLCDRTYGIGAGCHGGTF